MSRKAPALDPRRSFDPALADAPAAHSWWLSFTDLLAILLSFFVLAFAMGRPDPQTWSAMRGGLLDGFATGRPSVPTATERNADATTENGDAETPRPTTRKTVGTSAVPASDGARLAFAGEILGLKLVRLGLRSARVESARERLFVFVRADELDRLAERPGALRALAALFAPWARIEEIALSLPSPEAILDEERLAAAMTRLAERRGRLLAAGWPDADRWVIATSGGSQTAVETAWLRLRLAKRDGTGPGGAP